MEADSAGGASKAQQWEVPDASWAADAVDGHETSDLVYPLAALFALRLHDPPSSLGLYVISIQDMRSQKIYY